MQPIHLLEATRAARHVCIGLHLTAASPGLGQTLLHLYEATPGPFGLVVLVDPAPGEEEALAQTLNAVEGVLRLPVPAPGVGHQLPVAMPGSSTIWFTTMRCMVIMDRIWVKKSAVSVHSTSIDSEGSMPSACICSRSSTSQLALSNLPAS